MSDEKVLDARTVILMGKKSEVKKPRDDYPLREKCSHAKGWIGECRYAESCASCRFRKEVKKHVT